MQIVLIILIHQTFQIMPKNKKVQQKLVLEKEQRTLNKLKWVLKINFWLNKMHHKFHNIICIKDQKHKSMGKECKIQKTKD